MNPDALQSLSAIVLVIAVGWWSLAPVLVSAKDQRLIRRNPDHHKKLVRFYRAWGLLAIFVGLVVSFAAR